MAYNRGVKALTGMLAAAVWLSGCSGDIQNKEAVREGVIEHLAANSSLDIGSMDIEVTQVEFRGDEADATVSFQAKGTDDPAASMQMRYLLQKQGQRWVVKSRSGGSGAHGGGMGAPQGMPPPSGGMMPPGHPPIEKAPEGQGSTE